jgi:hypothetical protein
MWIKTTRAYQVHKMQGYASDLTHAEWVLIERQLRARGQSGGRISRQIARETAMISPSIAICTRRLCRPDYGFAA